jgi:NTE family protein
MAFKILALGGGGTKGILHLGALKFLEEKYGNLQEKFTGGFYGCSVGSIVATCLAYGLNTTDLTRITTKFTSFSQILFNDLSVSKFRHSISKKGLFDPRCLEDYIAKILNEEGIDLRGKKISDAPYPLFICSTNITKNCITVFKGDIPILDAISASSCIPLLFCPKIINSSAYIDGGFLTNIVLSYVPLEDRESTLSLSIIHDNPRVTPTNLERITTVEYLYSLYKISCIYERKTNKSWNNIDLNHNLSSGISDVSEKEKNDMISRGYELTNMYFTQRLN